MYVYDLQLCGELELATVEAQQMSVQARQAAEEAARRAEEAEQAAKEKVRFYNSEIMSILVLL